MTSARHLRLCTTAALLVLCTIAAALAPGCAALRIGIASYEPGAPVLPQNLTLGQLGWQLQVRSPVGVFLN